MNVNQYRINLNWKFGLYLFLLIISFSGVACAGSLHVEELQKIEGLHGEPLILERLCGDGVVTCSPITVQLVTQRDEVVAFVESEKLTAVFCPSFNFCWAFPYDSLLVTPFRLDTKNLDRQLIKNKRYVSDTAEAKIGEIRMQGFVPGPSWIKILSPAIIIADNWFLFFLVSCTTFISVLFFPFYYRKGFKWALPKRVLWFGFGLFSLIGYLAFCFIFYALLLVSWSEPPIYVQFFALIGLFVGWYTHRLIKRKPVEVE